MSRPSTGSNNSTLSSISSSCYSSYSAGTASIIVNQSTSSAIELPPRTTSLNFRHILLQSPSLLSLFEDEFENVDLAVDQESNNSKRSCCDASSISSISTTATDHNNLALHSNIITAAIQLSSLKGESILSLANGKASVLRQKSRRNNQNIKKEAPQHLFRWNSNPTTQGQQYYQRQDSKSDKDLRAKEFVDTLYPMMEPSFDSMHTTYIQKPPFAFFRY